MGEESSISGPMHSLQFNNQNNFRDFQNMQRISQSSVNTQSPFSLNQNIADFVLKGMSRSSLEALQNEIENVLSRTELNTPVEVSNGMSPMLKLVAAVNYLQMENTRLKSLSHIQSSLSTNGNISSWNIPSTNFQRLISSPISLLNERETSTSINESIVYEDKRDNKSNKRPHQCTFEGCQKSFAKASRLKRHKITHDEHRERFYCHMDNCNRSYGTKYDLVAHQKQKHNIAIKSYRCTFDNCEENFENRKSLEEHKLLHKKGCFTFAQLVFSFSGTFSVKRPELISKIIQAGAQVLPSVTHKVTHLVSTQADVAVETQQVKEARKRGVYIVSEEFVHRSIEEGKKQDESQYSLSDHIDFARLNQVVEEEAKQNQEEEEAYNLACHSNDEREYPQITSPVSVLDFFGRIRS